jgi:glutaredoxin
MRSHIPYATLALLILALPASAEIYRWVDSAGQVHFGDQPPRNVERVQQVRTPPPSDNPDAAKLRDASGKQPVTLFLTNCGDPCSQASNLLPGRGIPYAAKYVDRDPDAAKALRQLIGQLQVPTLKIGDSVQKGFEKNQWNNLLDLAGYPKPKAGQDTGKTPESPKAGK